MEIIHTNEYWDVRTDTILVVPDALTTGIFEGRYDGYDTNAHIEENCI